MCSSDLGVALSTAATATFTKPMDLASTAGAVSWRLVKDHLGVSTNVAVGVTISSDTTGQFITITPTAPLAGNGTYVVTITTAAKDVFGMTLSTATTIRFTTIMDHAVHNVVTDAASGMRVDIPAGALSSDGFLSGAVAPAEAADATRKLVSNSGDVRRQPVAGVASATVLDGGGNRLAFSVPVTVTLPYQADVNGIVNGTTPPVKSDALRIYWLDERTGTWQRLPSSIVDPASKTVSALAPAFTAFALMGSADTELTGVHAFPNPFLPGAGLVVTFSGLGDVSTVRIYTSQGVLVKEWTDSAGLGTTTWDGRNRSGEMVASGLYVYKITSGDNVAVGKLLVVR